MVLISLVAIEFVIIGMPRKIDKNNLVKCWSYENDQMQKWFHNQMLLPYLGGDDICHEEFFKMMKAIATHTL